MVNQSNSGLITHQQDFITVFSNITIIIMIYSFINISYIVAHMDYTKAY